MLRRYGTTGIYASIDIPANEPEVEAVVDLEPLNVPRLSPIRPSVRELGTLIRERWETAWFASVVDPVTERR